jgi:PKD domain
MSLAFGVNANVPAAANTSMVNIHSLLYAGHTTKIFLYDEPWWESGQELHTSCATNGTYPVSGTGANGYRFCFSHPDIGVSSDGPAHVKKLVDLAIARGFDGESANWYGTGRIEDASITAIMNYADPIKKADGTPAYLMTLNVDGGMVKACAATPNTTNCKDTQSWAGTTLNSNANCAAITNQNRATYTGAFTISTDRATCYVSKMIVAGMLYANQHFFQRPSYLKNAGRPLWTWFGNETIGYTDGAGNTTHTVVIDWAYVNSVLPQVGNPITLFRNTGGFTTNMTSGGGYCWIGHDGTPFDTNFDTGVSYMNSYYTTAKNTYASKINMGCADGAFNNRDASWACGSYPNCAKTGGSPTDAGDFKMTSHNCGVTMLTTIQAANAFYNASFQLPYLTLNTYNDYEEGSAFEPGINNCWNVGTPTIDGSKVMHWTLAGFDPDGASAYPNGGPEDAAHASLTTVDHFTVFASDGTNAADGTPRLYLVADNIPATESTVGCKCYSLGLSAFNLPTGTYSMYVKLQSKPLIHNSWSTTPVSYAAVGVGNVAPSASMTLSPVTGSAPLLVTADVSGSVDSDGTIVSKSINWGDGSAATVLTGTNVVTTHTYAAAGTFTVVNTVTDNSNATATATGSVTVAAAGTVLARMVVTPTTGVSPLLVSADTSASAASSGAAISSVVISWGDGSANTTLTAATLASHTFSGTAGNFNVTAIVTDSAGKSAQTTVVVSMTTVVNGGNSITIDTLADQAFVFSPVRVHATSTAGNGPVTRVQIYVDSVLVFDAQGLTKNPAIIDKYVFLNVGAWHQIMVQSYDAIGQSFTQTVNVFAEGTNQ